MVQRPPNFGKGDEKGQKWICLDLDGTVILKDPSEGSMKGICHPELIATLAHATTLGWNIAIITGRTYSFALPVISSFQFPYYFAVQQGSHLFAMPQKKLLIEHMLDETITSEVLSVFLEMKIPVIAYLGYEEGDACIYSLEHVSKELQAFYKKIEPLSYKPWKELPSLSKAKGFRSSLIKGFGESKETLFKVQKILQERFTISSTLIKDPLSLKQYYLMVTAPLATKGNIVKELISLKGPASHIIGAGDDENDLSMLQLSTYRIAMDDAPESLKEVADTIASSSDPLDLSKKLQALITT